MGVWVSNLSYWFISLIIICTLICHKRFSPTIAAKSPAFLTTIGIFATFLGISIGLLEFDAKDISNSVPKLITGLKTAFWSSAAGVLGALTIKGREILLGYKSQLRGNSIRGATIDDLANLLSKLQYAIAGTDDSTLVSQLKLLRVDSNERLDKLHRTIDEFYSRVADNNSKALIDALSEVMRDFNAKINEQFGDNFKQLNQAVEKILVWQEEYRKQIHEMISHHEVASVNMKAASDHFSQIVDRSSSFVKSSEALEKILSGLELQRTQIEQTAKSLGDLLANAGSNIPLLEKKIIEMAQQLTSGVKENHAHLHKLLADEMQKTNAEFNGQMRTLLDKTKEQVTVLDKALSEELTKSLESLGKQLAALSQKFAADYTPLTERLQQLVRAAG